MSFGSTSPTGIPPGTGSAFAQWGRRTFAANYAASGIASYMFAYDDGPGVRRGRNLAGRGWEGSARWHQNLDAMQARDPQAPRDKRGRTAYDKARGKYSKIAWKGRVLFGGALMGAMLYGEMSATEGGPGQKIRAGGAAVAGVAGWEVGGRAGALAGAKLGTALGPVGTAVGGLAGYFVGAFAGSEIGRTLGAGVYDALDSVASVGRRTRAVSNWVGDMSAFRTEKAATMRQMSMQMMNTGMMTARNALGHEGLILHQ